MARKSRAEPLKMPAAVPVQNVSGLIDVKITNGDIFIKLPNRTLFVEDQSVKVTPQEYLQLRQMGVC